MKNNTNSLSPLKLQACERFMLLAERIDPSSLLSRVASIGKNAAEYRLELIKTIQDEYNHNIAWQLYLNDELSLNLKEMVNQSILTINIAMQSLPEDAIAIDLSKNIVAEQAKNQVNIYFKFQSLLRKYINEV